jgi:hypothetical protein
MEITPQALISLFAEEPHRVNPNDLVEEERRVASAERKSGLFQVLGSHLGQSISQIQFGSGDELDDRLPKAPWHMQDVAPRALRLNQ